MLQFISENFAPKSNVPFLDFEVEENSNKGLKNVLGRSAEYFRDLTHGVLPERVGAFKESFLYPDFNILGKDNDDLIIRESLAAILKPITTLIDKKMMLPLDKTQVLMDQDIIKMLLALPDEVLANVLEAAVKLLHGVGGLRQGLMGSLESSVPAITGLLKEFSLNVSDVVRDGLTFKTQILPGHLFEIIREVVSIADNVFQLDEVLGTLPQGFRPRQKDLLKLMKVLDPQRLLNDKIDVITSPFNNLSTDIHSQFDQSNANHTVSNEELGDTEFMQAQTALFDNINFLSTAPIKSMAQSLLNKTATADIPMFVLDHKELSVKKHLNSIVSFVEFFTKMFDEEARNIANLGIEGEHIVYQVAKYVLDDLVLQGSLDVSDAALRLVNVFGTELYGMTRKTLNGIVPQLRSVQVIDDQMTEAMDKLMGLYKNYVDVVGIAAFSIEEFYTGKMDVMRNIVNAQ